MKRGDLGGTLFANVKKLKGAGAYELQITEGDPTVPVSWHYYSTFKNSRKIEIAGQPPGKTVSVRLRGIGGNGPGAWSDAGSLMVA